MSETIRACNNCGFTCAEKICTYCKSEDVEEYLKSIDAGICKSCSKNPCNVDKNGLSKIIECVLYEKLEPKIGDKVYAAMVNDFNIQVGVFEKEVDLFAPYGVRLENGELKYFMRIEKFED